MTFRQLLGAFFPTASLSDNVVTTITENTEQANAASVFVCIRGARADGHELAYRAYANGCRVFIVERAIDLPHDAKILETDDTRKALARLACAFYGHSSHRMHVIGITGTKGKTTTAQLLSHVLNQNAIPCGYIGTNGILYGNVCEKTVNTTPDAVTLQRTLHEMQAAGMRAVVIEVSSQALMQARADGTHFETVVFTNLSLDHVGLFEHPSFEHYRDCKKRLFRDFDAHNAVWNLDDAHTEELRIGCTISRQITCSVAKAADCTAQNITPIRTPTSVGVTFAYHTSKGAVPCSLPLVGTCNVSNALLASAVATEVFEIAPSAVSTSLKSCSVDGRSEWVALPNGATAVIDYAHNGESLRQILGALREYEPHRLICLFGSVGERSQLRRAELGRTAAALADVCILTSDNPGNESPTAIIDEIAAQIEPFGLPCYKIPDRQNAIEFALRLVEPNDILLLAGKGHEQYQLVGHERRPFSERSIIADYIQKLQMPMIN